MIGQTLSHYKITARIGAGGMGVVWKALDTRLEREIALKTLAASNGTDPEHRHRFLREARAASSLNHPNVVTVYEINRDGDVDFIAMEYVSGESLADVLKRGALPVAKAISYAVQIAEGLARAHSAGIVHRDLKPANIMVTDEGLVKILDFGLARVVPAANAAEAGVTVTALTLPGTAVGTPAYMSPEQIVGDQADARSDIFSFGIILYEFFAGRSPFAGTSTVDTVHSLLAKEPQPLSSLAPAAPRQIERIAARCLSKRREDRYESAAALLSELKLLERPPEQSRQWRRAGVAATVLTAAAIAIAFPALRLREAASSGTTDRTPQQLTADANELLSNYHRPQAIERAIASLEEAIRKAPNSAAAYAALSHAYLRRSGNTRDRQWRDFAAQYARKAVELDPHLAASRLALGNTELESGKPDQALATLRAAADLDPKNAAIAMSLAKVLAAQGKPTEAETMFTQAIRFAPRQWIPPTEYGLFLYGNARFEDSAKAFEQAAALSTDNGVILRNWSGALVQLERYDEAAGLLQRALEIQPAAGLYTNLGYVRFFQGRYLDAIGPMEQAVKLNPNNFRFWGNLADAYRWTPGNREKATEAYTRGIQLAQDGLKAAPSDVNIRSSLSVYLAKAGRSREAVEEIGSIIRGTKAMPAAVQFKIALAYEIAGRREEALKYVESALKAGHPLREFTHEPDLERLRADVRYHRVLAARQSR